MSLNYQEKTGIIIMLDVLGTNGLWSRADSQEWVKKFNSIIAGIKQENEVVSKGLGNLDPNKKFIDEPKIFTLSKTVVITYPGTDPELILSRAALALIRNFSLSFFAGVFLRGTISYGKFFQSESMIVGPAIDEAIEWCSRYNWMGITLSPSTKYLLESALAGETKKINPMLVFHKQFFKKYDIPLDEGIDKDEWALAWQAEFDKTMKMVFKQVSDNPPPHYTKGDNPGEGLNYKSVLLKVFSQNFPGSISKQTYDNTLKFYDYLKLNNP